MSQNVLDDEDLKLEETCDAIDCIGFNSDCSICKGTGLVPTAFGLKILDFINRYLPTYLEELKEKEQGK